LGDHLTDRRTCVLRLGKGVVFRGSGSDDRLQLRLIRPQRPQRLLALLEIGHYIVPVLVQCRLEQVIFGEPVQIAAKVLVISEITSRARESSAR